MRFYNFLSQVKPTLMQTLEAVKTNIRYNLNCVKIAIVEEFIPSTLEVRCKIVNKKLIGLNPDGSQILRDYPLITARCHFFGWGNVGATYPIEKGMEGFLLFNDRELESWFINGDVNPLSYTRCHDLTDAIFICGIHSKPNMINIVANCLALFYKNTSIKLMSDSVSIDGETTVTGKLTADGIVDTTAFTGTFQDNSNRTVTVENGIIKSVS